MNVTRSTMICIWAIKCKKLNPILFLSLLIFLWTVDTWNHQFLSVDWLLISQFSWRDYVFLKGRRIDNKEGMIKKGENLFSTTPLDSCFYWSHTLSKNYTCLLFKICWNIFCLFVCFVFFYLGFLSQPSMNHRIAGEEGGHFFNSSPPLPPILWDDGGSSASFQMCELFYDG